ncbi:MAG: hypothetical protein KAJ55_09235 [Anaerolineales bacterium]|nr:hypothetical protein [Anaerolineales bacterium]
MQTAVARKQEENKITGPASAPSAEPHVDLKTENTPRAASTPLLQRQPIEQEEKLQAKPESGHISNVNPALESQIQSLKGLAQPLSENDRAYSSYFLTALQPLTLEYGLNCSKFTLNQMQLPEKLARSIGNWTHLFVLTFSLSPQSI